MEAPPRILSGDPPERTEERLNTLVPEDPLKAYNMYEVIEAVFDKGSFFEVSRDYARNAITGFARLNGWVVGVVANQPMVLTGALDINASDKITRFVRILDAFNIPIVTFVDVPGYIPGTYQEHNGIIRHGAKVLYAYSEATVPKLTVIVRKAYGGAYIAMSSRHLGADFVIAWPTAEIAVMGAEGAAEIIWRAELSKAKTPEERQELLNKLANEYKNKFLHPYIAAARGYIDSVIEPAETRPTLVRALEFLLTKREVRFRMPPKKHGLIPM